MDVGESEQIRYSATVERLPEQPSRILHVGCARHDEERRSQANLHDYLLEFLEDTCSGECELIGIDILEEEITLMQSEGYNVQRMDAEDLEFDEPFDAIVTGEVIEHLANPGKFLVEATENLASDGRLVLTTPNPDGFAYFRKALLSQPNNPTHTCWIDPGNLRRLVQVSSADLTLVESQLLPPTGGVSMALWRLGRRRAASPHWVATLERS